MIFGLLCMLAGSLLSGVLNLAKGQLTCPYGYYLATNNLCYPYQQQQQQQPPQTQTADPDLVHICKIDRDMIAVDKSLGVNASKLLALEKLYNDTCGTIVGVK